MSHFRCDFRFCDPACCNNAQPHLVKGKFRLQVDRVCLMWVHSRRRWGRLGWKVCPIVTPSTENEGGGEVCPIVTPARSARKEIRIGGGGVWFAYIYLCKMCHICVSYWKKNLKRIRIKPCRHSRKDTSSRLSLSNVYSVKRKRAEIFTGGDADTKSCRESVLNQHGFASTSGSQRRHSRRVQVLSEMLDVQKKTNEF